MRLSVVSEKKVVIFALSFTFRYKPHILSQLSEVKVTIYPSLTFTFTTGSKTSCFTSLGIGERSVMASR